MKLKDLKKETLIEIGVKLEERFLARILASKRLIGPEAAATIKIVPT